MSPQFRTPTKILKPTIKIEPFSATTLKSKNVFQSPQNFNQLEELAEQFSQSSVNWLSENQIQQLSQYPVRDNDTIVEHIERGENVQTDHAGKHFESKDVKLKINLQTGGPVVDIENNEYSKRDQKRMKRAFVRTGSV